MTNASVIQVNVTETDITRMASDYADNELELFRKTVNAYSQQIIYIYIYDVFNVFIEHIPLNIHSAVEKFSELYFVFVTWISKFFFLYCGDFHESLVCPENMRIKMRI